MSLIFERYLEDEQPEKKDVGTEDEMLQRKIEAGEEKRKRLLDKVKGGPIRPDETKGVWL